jgi:hypothetical protein
MPCCLYILRRDQVLVPDSMRQLKLHSSLRRLHHPVRVLMRHCFCFFLLCVSVGGQLANRIQEEFNSDDRGLITLCGVRRRYFNESQGLDLIKHTASERSYNLLSLDSTLYLCVSAANAVVRYIVSGQNKTTRRMEVALQELPSDSIEFWMLFDCSLNVGVSGPDDLRSPLVARHF